MTLLTGFLGSGKTTLLNEWLQSPELANAAVIVNEFGEIGIDHALIASSNDNTIELSTGCLCCTVRGDLVDTLRELQTKRASGEVRNFDRVIIETTGLADPAPVIQALMTFPVVRRFRLNEVVTAVDAVQGRSTLSRHLESVRQAAVADDIVITKTDLSGADADNVAAEIKRFNPGVRIHHSSISRKVRMSDFGASDIYDPTTKIDDVAQWLRAEAYGTGAHDHHHHHDVNRHNAEIGSFCLTYEEPLRWEHVANWLDSLVIAHGDQLLRVKGILAIEGREKPIVVQAVQRLFHPPFELVEWPGGERSSRIVFITQSLSREFVAEVFNTIRGKQPTTAH